MTTNDPIQTLARELDSRFSRAVPLPQVSLQQVATTIACVEAANALLADLGDSTLEAAQSVAILCLCDAIEVLLFGTHVRALSLSERADLEAVDQALSAREAF